MRRRIVLAAAVASAVAGEYAAIAQVPDAGIRASAAGIASAVAAARESGIPEIDPRSTASAMVPADAADPVQGEGPVRSLAEAVALAARGNPRLASQRATHSAAQHGVAVARGVYGPTLDVQGSYGFTSDRNDTQFGTRADQQGWTSSAAAVLNQPLTTFGRNRAGEAVARAQAGFTAEQVRLVENDLLLNVVADYVGVIRDANAVSIARQNCAILGKQLDDDTARFGVREITATDLQQVQNRYAAARAALVQAEGQLGASQARFLRDVGAPPGELAAPDLIELPVATLEEAYLLADAESPAIAAARARELASRGEADGARAAWLPRVDLRGTASIGTLTPYTDEWRTRRLQAEVTATIPLLDMRRAPRVAEAHETNRADLLLVDQAVRENRADVAAAWNALASSRASLGWYITALDAARAAYEGARIEERAGQRTTFEVLDLARDLLFVQTGYNSALANEYIARASLLAAMGRLTAGSLLAAGADATGAPRSAARPEIPKNGDIPALTPLLRLIDLPMLSSGTRPRAIVDPGTKTKVDAATPLVPDSPQLRIDPAASPEPR